MEDCQGVLEIIVHPYSVQATVSRVSKIGGSGSESRPSIKAKHVNQANHRGIFQSSAFGHVFHVAQFNQKYPNKLHFGLIFHVTVAKSV